MSKQNRPRQIKVFLSLADHDRVRLAAALRRTGMSDFCRGVVLSEALRLTQGLSLDEGSITTEPNTNSKRSICR